MNQKGTPLKETTMVFLGVSETSIRQALKDEDQVPLSPSVVQAGSRNPPKREKKGPKTWLPAVRFNFASLF